MFEEAIVVLIVLIVGIILGRATEKMKWLERFIDFEGIRDKIQDKDSEKLAD